jgi:hypothetical protein
MLSDRNFVKQSLDINLFFLRIMKEHSFFLETSLLDKNADLQKEARGFAKTFGDLLVRTAKLGLGVVGLKNDMVTEHTLDAERMSEFLTGVPLDRNITRLELQLACPHDNSQCHPELVKDIYELNCEVIEATKAIFDFKTQALKAVLECKLYTTAYPLLIDHIRREAGFFIDILVKLQRREDVDIIEDALNQEAFWNRIMAEHSKFVRGLLDPTEENLIETANDFANEFDELRRKALAAADKTGMLGNVTDESLEATKRLRDFKEQADEGLLECKIRSIALPLLADHILREANHYLMLLRKYDSAL